MQLYLDINSTTAVSGLGSLAPAPVYNTVVSDQLNLDIYLLQNGIAQNYGLGVGIQFGLAAAANPGSGAIVLCQVFDLMTDVSGNAFYRGVPEFATTEMYAAIGAAPSINCVGEVKWSQGSQIVYSLPFPWTITAALIPDDVPAPSVIANYPSAEQLVLVTEIDQPFGVAGLNASGELSSTAVLPPGLVYSSQAGQPDGLPILTQMAS